MPALSTPYRVMYGLGFKPWDNGQIPDPVREVVEGPEAMPPGRALDLGCGTGTQSVYLGQHGWDVTGIDLVSRPLEEAQRKSMAAGVHPKFLTGDITELQHLQIGAGYSLILDVACFHGLPAGKRQRTADQITQVADAGAVFLMFGFVPGHRGPLPSGIDSEEITHLFGSSWDLVWQRESTEVALRGPLRNARPTGYFLRKR